FINVRIGWGYSLGLVGGIHTTNGGDTTFLTGIKQISSEIPKQFKLYQNYPNPFNPATNIKYQIKANGKSEKAKVKIIVYDITGRHITDLVNQLQSAGTYSVDFSGNNLSSGVYFYHIAIHSDKLIIGNSKEEYTETKKMILLK